MGITSLELSASVAPTVETARARRGIHRGICISSPADSVYSNSPPGVLSRFEKYADIFDIDGVPEVERK